MQTMGNWDSYRGDLDALKSEFEKLIEARNDVMKRIKIAEEEEEQQHMKPTNEVQQWLSSVQAVETEVDELIKQASEEIERLHPGGFCSRTFNSMSSSYEMEDMVADKLQAVTNLINEGAFLVVADEVPVVTTLIDEGAPEVTLPEDVADDDQCTIVGMESMINEVLRCLKTEEDVGIIGVYGMGGVGKTTLLKQINKNLDLEMKNDFDVVIWVVVSRDLQLDKIQQQIGKKIGLFDNKNFEEKASDIFKILKEKKFVLLMDDLWERVDLTKVGVPLPNPENSSKIVFTTRSLQICSLMEAGKLFKVTCLSDEEAWKLFRASVGEENLHAHPEVPEIARDVSRACYGLPLALVTFGHAMANKKTPQEWSDLLQVLSMSSYSGSDYELKESIYYNLKLSYDFLQNDMFRSCLLYCCLFPRNNEISKGELIDCWIGEGFLDERIGAQSQGYYIIGVLLSTCLLEEGKDENGVKMPNWIHEMSWWIANDIEGEKGNLFYCTIEAPESKKWENVTRISVMKNMTRNLIDAPKSPHLQTLFLYKNGLEMINGDFFQFLPFLRVLNLSKNHFLTKLPSGISNLVSLQHLDLSRTYLRELPNQLGDLKKLKCLNLEETYGLHTIPKQLISKFSMLHVLRLWDCGFMLQSTEDSVVCNDAQLLIEELLSLKNLSMLSITLNNSHALQRLLSSNRLQSCTESLYLQYLYHPKSVKVPLTDLKNLNTLNILNCVYLEEVEVDFVGETQAIRESPSRFYFLDKVIIKGCPRLWDLTWLILAPNLKSLEISDCIRMEEIINVGKLSPELMGNVIPFSKLKRLILVRLPKLRSIYWRVLPFPDVMELTIADCPMPPLPPHLLNMVNVTSVVSWTRSPIWKLRDRIKLVKKEQGSTHNQLDRSPIKGELWGGNEGRDWDCHPKNGILGIKIRHSDVVDSLVFEYADENSGVITSEKVGGNSGVHESSIEFHRPNEYLTRIWGNIVTFNNEEVVGNLCFYTNQHRVYGPYGCLFDGKPFEFFEKNRAITGFFGREGNFINAIGVYYQYPPAPIRISQEINKEKPKGAYTWSKPEVTEKSFVGEVKRDGDFKNLEKVGSRKVELSGGSRITRAIG